MIVRPPYQFRMKGALEAMSLGLGCPVSGCASPIALVPDSGGLTLPEVSGVKRAVGGTLRHRARLSRMRDAEAAREGDS